MASHELYGNAYYGEVDRQRERRRIEMEREAMIRSGQTSFTTSGGSATINVRQERERQYNEKITRQAEIELADQIQKDEEAKHRALQDAGVSDEEIYYSLIN